MKKLMMKEEGEHWMSVKQQHGCLGIHSGVAGLLFGLKEKRMCRYAEKRREGNDLKTFCHAHVEVPYPVSDSYGHFPYMRKWCEGGRYWKCTIFGAEAPEGKFLFSILLGSFLWLVAFPFIILKGITNPLLWNLVSLIGIIATFFGYLQNEAIRRYLKKIIQSKEEGYC